MASLAPDMGTLWTPDAMAARVVRYADLVPCTNAFIDTRTPGSETKENFTIIGPGVSENPDQHVHIAEPHGFNIGGARQPPGCVNSQHSHETAEIFVVHSGVWQINIGERGDDAQVIIRPGDVISVPTGLFRGFTNVGDDIGFLWVVLGRDDPGRVLWAPYVFDMAEAHGLVLLENGNLVDRVAGQSLPDDVAPMPRTSAAQVAALTIPTAAELEALVWRDCSAGSPASCPSGYAHSRPLIGRDAPLPAQNDIRMARIDLGAGGQLAMPAAEAPRVLFVHRGAPILSWDRGQIALGTGDTMTIPLGVAHRIDAAEGAVLYHVGA